MTLPYTVSVEIFGPSLADQSVTVTLFCQGLGNLIGNLPAGKIYAVIIQITPTISFIVPGDLA